MNGKSNWRVKARAFFAASTVLIFLTTFTAISIVPAKAGTCTGSFPADNLWKPIRSPIGNVLIDADSDLSATGDRRSNVDIYGTAQVGNTPAASAVDWYSTGTTGCFMFRIRVYATARSTQGATTRIDGSQWIVGIGTGTTANAYVVVNGNNSGDNDVYIYDGSWVKKQTYTFTLFGSASSYGLHIVRMVSGTTLRCKFHTVI